MQDNKDKPNQIQQEDQPKGQQETKHKEVHNESKPTAQDAAEEEAEAA